MELSNGTNEPGVKTEPQTDDFIHNDDTGSHLHYSDFEQLEAEDSAGSRQEFSDESYMLSNLSGKERKRTRNFTPREASLLCNLLEDHFDVLEKKTVDVRTNTQKHIAWNDITQKFNANTDFEYRTTMQLKTFYENLKKRRRKALLEGTPKPSNEIPVKKLCTPYEIFQPHAEGFVQNPTKSFSDMYEKKRIELINLEIENAKKEREEQNRLFLLQEEKLKLEIDEIKARMKQGKQSTSL